jgi:putative oxidoreductase
MEPRLLFALLAGIVEFFGGLALVFGFLTRAAALALTVLLGVATSVHLGNGFFWTDGGFEYPLLWSLLALAVLLRGGGSLSIDARLGLRI